MLDSRKLAVFCKGVTKTYHTEGADVHALRGIDLEVFAGELMMLVGPSGCGKTTLISIIAGILNQDRGECHVFGENLKSLSDLERTTFRSSNIGFVFQSFNLIPTLTVGENISVPLLINGTPLKEALKRSMEVLEQVGIGERINAYPHQLSGGQQQRVAIARAIVHAPKLIVCDEPTASLDLDTGLRVMEIFKGLAKSGNKTLIVVSHDSRIFSFADRIAKLNDGSLESISESNEEHRV